MLLGRGISVALDRVPTKLLTSRRGGYRYEHGVLFAAVPGRLGYCAGRLLARIGDKDSERPRPRTHMTLRVQAESSRWLADAGFGAGLPEPVPWNHTGTPQRQGGWPYQLSQTGNNWQLRQRIAGQWATLYSFTEESQHASDVEMACHLTSTYPNSPFAGHTDLRDARPEGPCFAGDAERQNSGAQCAYARDLRSSPAP